MMSHHHARTDSSSSSSTACSTAPPSTTSSDEGQCDALAWHQMPSVRLWKQRTNPLAHLLHVPESSAQRTPRATPESDARGPSPPLREATHSIPQHFVFHAKPPPPAPPKAKPVRKSRTPPTDGDEGDSDSTRKVGPYGCPVRGCPQVLRGRDPKTWLRHLDSHWSHVYKRYTCPRCKAEFSRPESVMRHAQTKQSCHDVRTTEIIEKEACWLSPAYARFLEPPPRLHPLFKILQPVIERAQRDESIAHPSWPVLQPQIK